MFPPLAPPTGQSQILNANQEFSAWRLPVEPMPFNNGLEGISGLPLEVYHATSAIGAAPPAMSSINMEDPSTWTVLPHDTLIAIVSI